MSLLISDCKFGYFCQSMIAELTDEVQTCDTHVDKCGHHKHKEKKKFKRNLYTRPALMAQWATTLAELQCSAVGLAG